MKTQTYSQTKLSVYVLTPKPFRPMEIEDCAYHHDCETAHSVDQKEEWEKALAKAAWYVAMIAIIDTTFERLKELRQSIETT